MKPETFTLFWRICKQVKESGKSNKSLLHFGSYFSNLIFFRLFLPKLHETNPLHFVPCRCRCTHRHTHTHTHTYDSRHKVLFFILSTIQQSLPCPHFQVPVQRHKHYWLPTQNPFSLLRQLQYYPGGQCVQLKCAASPAPLQLGWPWNPFLVLRRNSEKICQGVEESVCPCHTGPPFSPTCLSPLSIFLSFLFFLPGPRLEGLR